MRSTMSIAAVLTVFAVPVTATAADPVTVKVFDKPAWKVAMSPDGTMVAVGEKYGTDIALWYLPTQKVTRLAQGAYGRSVCHSILAGR